MAWPEGGKRLPLWDAVYDGDVVAAQKLLVTKAGAAQVNVPHGVSVNAGSLCSDRF
jgi:hypothetical protein